MKTKLLKRPRNTLVFHPLMAKGGKHQKTNKQLRSNKKVNMMKGLEV